ncbi:MAG: hypothetical protein M1839_007305, partial [Geoglossum umbratile]
LDSLGDENRLAFFIPTYEPAAAGDSDAPTTAANDIAVVLTIGNAQWASNVNLFCSFLLSAALQTVSTMVLHLAELLVNISRDEAIWRAANTSKGAAINPGALKSAASSWQCLVLFSLKPLTQWLYGSVGITIDLTGFINFCFNAIPLFTVAGIMLTLLSFGEYLARSKYPGPQPAAFGHLQTLVDLIDDWGSGKDGKLFWGSHLESLNGIGIFGTSSTRSAVQPVHIGQLYQ